MKLLTDPVIIIAMGRFYDKLQASNTAARLLAAIGVIFTIGLIGFALFVIFNEEHSPAARPSMADDQERSESLFSFGGPSAQETAQAIALALKGGFLDKRLRPGPEKRQLIKDTAAAYDHNNNLPIWDEDGGAHLLRAILAATPHGIPRDPELIASVEEALSALDSDLPEIKAQADILLSAAFFRYAHTRAYGSTEPKAVSSLIDPAPDSYNFEGALFKAGQDGFAYRNLDPQMKDFHALDLLLARYEKFALQGGFVPIPDGAKLVKGSHDQRVVLLRQRLQQEGFFESEGFFDRWFDTSKAQTNPKTKTDKNAPAEAGPDYFDAALEGSLRRFQTAHGLDADGALGGDTIVALNESAQSKAERIRANMERWRWQPRELGARHVRVNIPAYRAEGWIGDKRAIGVDAIVGQVGRMTPIFSDQIEFIVGNPTWSTPTSILVKDKLPKIRADSGYLYRNDFVVYERATNDVVDPSSVDWNADGVERRYRIVQQPGDGNALGALKIMFPNKYSVYLHGTPSVELFAKTARAFSSGCVRIKSPEKFADWLAEGDTKLTTQAIAEALSDPGTETLHLGEPVPIHLQYFTVFVADDGTPQFRRDIYGIDRAGVAALKEDDEAFAAMKMAQNWP